jgi:hypothetical protein
MNSYLKNVRKFDLPVHPIKDLKPDMKSISVQGLVSKPFRAEPKKTIHKSWNLVFTIKGISDLKTRKKYTIIFEMNT